MIPPKVYYGKKQSCFRGICYEKGAFEKHLEILAEILLMGKHRKMACYEEDFMIT